MQYFNSSSGYIQSDFAAFRSIDFMAAFHLFDLTYITLILSVLGIDLDATASALVLSLVFCACISAIPCFQLEKCLSIDDSHFLSTSLL